jgi:hypothetical protein
MIPTNSLEGQTQVVSAIGGAVRSTTSHHGNIKEDIMKKRKNDPNLIKLQINGGRTKTSYPTTPETIMSRSDQPRPRRIWINRRNNGRKWGKYRINSKRDNNHGYKRQKLIDPQAVEISCRSHSDWSKSEKMESGHRRTMAGEKTGPLRNKDSQPRKGRGSHPAGTPTIINCRVARVVRGARTRYQNLCSVEEKELMGRVQEEVLRKRKNMSDEEIMWSVKEWVPHPGKSRTRDTKFFHLAEVYWMTKAMVAQAMV